MTMAGLAECRLQKAEIAEPIRTPGLRNDELMEPEHLRQSQVACQRKRS